MDRPEKRGTPRRFLGLIGPEGTLDPRRARAQSFDRRNRRRGRPPPGRGPRSIRSDEARLNHSSSSLVGSPVRCRIALVPARAREGASSSVTVADGSPLFRIGLVAVLEDEPGFAVADEASRRRPPRSPRSNGAARPSRSSISTSRTRAALGVLEATSARASPTRILLLAAGESRRALPGALAGSRRLPRQAQRGRPRLRRDPRRRRRRDRHRRALPVGLAAEIRLRERGERPALTDREREVLALTADGGSVADVAGRLHLSDATIKTHLHHAYEKLDVSDRAAAVAGRCGFGLID